MTVSAAGIRDPRRRLKKELGCPFQRFRNRDPGGGGIPGQTRRLPPPRACGCPLGSLGTRK